MMEDSQIYEELSLIRRRATWVYVAVCVLFVLLVLSFWKIQILDHKKYWALSESNRTREVIIPSRRGLIKDRNDRILAKSIASFRASIIRENCKDFEASSQNIAHLLDLEESVLRERIKKYESFPLSYPIVVKDNLSFEDVSHIEARKIELPEMILQLEPKRFYPNGQLAAHILGYLQELSPRDIQSDLYPDRQLGDLIGRTGIEKQYDDLLEGTDGRVIEIVDSLGRRKGEIFREDPIQGKWLNVTLDFDIQEKAETLLEGREGAIVVLDPRNGDILALASYPTFDPNKFINRFTPEEWQTLVQSPEFPLENRAIRGLYSPGSVFKLTMALAALDSRVISEGTSFYCSGSIRVYGQPRQCWFKPGHGAMTLTSGIQRSCNIYFYQLGKKMDIEDIHRYATLLSFGTRSGVDLPGEKAGLVPNSEWKKRVRDEPWYPGETISVSIGQGPLLVTPLQVAVHTALIANRGAAIRPHILKTSQDDQFSQENTPPNSQKTGISADTYEKVIKGMWRSVNEGGTGRGARVNGFNICGKTGSTQLVSTAREKELLEMDQEIKTHSWFTGFGPKDDPEIVVTVLVEYGGMGGATAAPLARQLFDLYLKKYD
jgi:penicillin-binding protein 2